MLIDLVGRIVMLNQTHCRVYLAVIFALLLTACSGPRVMMPTPNVQLDSSSDIYTGLPEELKGTQVPLFYITDRRPEKTRVAI